jgi:hypothetical protein
MTQGTLSALVISIAIHRAPLLLDSFTLETAPSSPSPVAPSKAMFALGNISMQIQVRSLSRDLVMTTKPRMEALALAQSPLSSSLWCICRGCIARSNFWNCGLKRTHRGHQGRHVSVGGLPVPVFLSLFWFCAFVIRFSLCLVFVRHSSSSLNCELPPFSLGFFMENQHLLIKGERRSQIEAEKSANQNLHFVILQFS